jgi:branched-chain amino acid transport system ATP-binding protein
LLEFLEAHTYYGDSHILQGVSLKVDKGTAVGLLGRNGMGKTTTLYSAIGFVPPRAGKIFFKKEEITHLSSYQIAKRGMALVPQGARIFPSLTVKENLLIAFRKGKGDRVWSLEKVFNLFPALRERQVHKGNQLSGGERNMLAIGRALISNSDFLLMDEPTEGLAPIIVHELRRVMERLKLEGLSILLAEQNFAFALGIADKVYILHKGVITFEGTPDEIKEAKEVQDQFLAV